VLLHHATFCINSWCHTFGKKNFTKEHSGKDSSFMAFFTFGEGYHNFHHTFANDYRNGIRWYHWDPTKWAIGLMAKLKLARDLKVTSDDMILAARLTMDETTLKETWAHRWEVALEEKTAQLKQRVAEAQLRWLALKQEYKQLKAAYSEAHRARMEALRMEIKIAHREFKRSWAQWRAHHSGLLVAATVRV
jgi:stearoyl-CoA desaturase (delta-9 desaturase)